MFDFFHYLIVLAVVVLGVAIFNFQPDFKIFGLELKKIAYWRIHSVEVVAFRLSIVSAFGGASYQTRPTNIVGLRLKDNLIISVTPRNVPEFCERVEAIIQSNAGKL